MCVSFLDSSSTLFQRGFPPQARAEVVQHAAAEVALHFIVDLHDERRLRRRWRRRRGLSFHTHGVALFRPNAREPCDLVFDPPHPRLPFWLLIVRRFPIAEVVPVYVCLFPSCFWTCPTSAPTLQSALSRYSAISTLFEIRNSSSKSLFGDAAVCPTAPHSRCGRPRQRERERESRREN